MRRRLLWVVGLTVFNIVAYNLFVRNGGYDISGAYVPYSPQVALEASLYGFLLGFPLLCALLGSVVALIPIGGRSYARRFKRSSLAMLIAVHGVIGAMLILIATGTLFGFYPGSGAAGKSSIENDPVMLQLAEEVKALSDSGSVYMDTLLADAMDGEISSIDLENTTRRLEEVGGLINDKFMSIYEHALEIGMPAAEYDSMMAHLHQHITLVQRKQDSLISMGVHVK